MNKYKAGWNARGFAQISFILFALCLSSAAQPARSFQRDADTLVRQLKDLPTPLPASISSDGSIPPEERRRRVLYQELLRLGPKGILALSRALHDDDVHLRKNAALALGALSGGWFDPSWPKLDIRLALPALKTALQDNDSNVRAWSAQAIGNIGPDGEKAVPDLITLLSSPDVGSRNSACIALRGIGPAAKQALPMLTKSLSDPDKDVRRFAALAIASIER